LSPNTTNISRKTKMPSVSTYYDSRDGYRGPYAEYERLIASHLQPGKSLLDIGCGRTFPMAEKWLTTGADIYGVDPVIDSGAILNGVEVVQGSAEKVPYPDEMFDLIVSCAVLEHLEKPLPIFQEFHRLLKPNGRAILLTPNKYDYVSLAARIIPNKFHGQIVHATEGREEHDTFPTFYLANSRKQISNLAQGSGFVMEKYRYLDQSPYSLRFNPFLYRIGCWYHWVVRSFKGLDFLNGWILCVLAKSSN